jgi:hypothetical protein
MGDHHGVWLEHATAALDDEGVELLAYQRALLLTSVVQI